MPGGRSAVDRRAQELYDDEAGGPGDERRAASRRDERRPGPPPSPVAVTRAVLRDIAELTGKQPSGITALERDNGGWVVEVEVVEDRRIPSSGDILSLYRAQTTAAGALTAFRRIRRYQRGTGKD